MSGRAIDGDPRLAFWHTGNTVAKQSDVVRNSATPTTYQCYFRSDFMGLKPLLTSFLAKGMVASDLEFLWFQ